MDPKKTLNAYYPGKKFPAVSVTGNKCSLNCAHCGGHYLESMISADSPDMLYNTCKSLKENGATGVLISGGCEPSGHIHLEPFYESMKQIRQDTGLIINLHTGLLDPDEVKMIADAGVDAVSFDLVGDESVLRNVYNLDNDIKEYEACLRSLVDAGISVVPHICIGLNPGNTDGEKRLLEMLEPLNLARLIFIIFIPTRGTKMAQISPPDLSTVTDVISSARTKLANTELVLGCMRPRRPERYELSAIEAGVSGIVLPSSMTLNELRSEGWEIIKSEQCCAF